MPRRTLEIWLPLVILALDQVTKELVRREPRPARKRDRSFPGLLDFTHVRNTGAAFGILNSADFPYKTVVIVLIASAGLVGVAVYSASLPSHQLLARVGLALIIGGAAGNLIDRDRHRLRRRLRGRLLAGRITSGRSTWPTRRLRIGVAIMILDMLGVRAHVSKTA